MNVYGPHQDQTAAYTGVIPIMLNKISQGETPDINGDGTQAYDFVTARDAARCNVLALKSDVVDEFFNVGTGVQTSIDELCSLLLELTGSKLKVEYVPYSEEDIRRLVQHRIGSPVKAERMLGFRSQDDLQSGLAALIAWRAENENA